MENNLTYTQVGDYLIPNLALPEQPDRDLGKYGRMRRTYLKEHRPGLFNRMTLNGTLFSHLLEIEDAANSRLEQMMPQLAKAAGATEQLKASDQMKWVGFPYFIQPKTAKFKSKSVFCCRFVADCSSFKKCRH